MKKPNLKITKTTRKRLSIKTKRNKIRLAYKNASNAVRDTYSEEMKTLRSLDYDGIEVQSRPEESKKR